MLYIIFSISKIEDVECNQEILKAMGYGEVNKNTCMHACINYYFALILMCFASIAIDENEEEMIEIPVPYSNLYNLYTYILCALNFMQIQ